MKCPACSGGLAERKIEDLTVDVCDKGCGGIWFDNFELKKVDEKHESHGEALLDVSPHTAVPVDHAAKRFCPKCDGIVMQRNFFSVRKEVEIDRCPGCNGVWLDAGELAAIRAQFANEQQRAQAAKDHFKSLFSEQLEEKAEKSTENLAAKRDFARALKYVLPSYWIPGRQKGGAF